VIEKKKLNNLYKDQRLSSSEIANRLDCSTSKVDYWLKKHSIEKRSVSEAIYAKNNPDGDPFEPASVESREEAFLYGMGLGLYWGEGTKSSEHAVRLGNTDPDLIKMFIRFLEQIYSIDKSELSFGLQIFGDLDKEKVLSFWCKELDADKDQFYKVTVTPKRGVGNYNTDTKTTHGVLTVYFNNTKLRDIVCKAIENPSLPE